MPLIERTRDAGRRVQPGQPLDAVIVGGGFAGLYMLHKLLDLGFDVQVLEAADSVGGVWYWNRYPGARCDVESMQYSYSFSENLQQDWKWHERFATQPEILSYLNHVADRFELRGHIRLGTRVESAKFDEDAGLWLLRTTSGDSISARFCLMATGCLSQAKTPDIAGYGSFSGKTYNTSDWPHEGVDFAGQRVAVVGTGSSGVQAIPIIAEQAAQLTVFQRTANYSVPARNAPMTPEYEQHWKSNYAHFRNEARHRPSGTLYTVGTKSALEVSDEERQQEFEARWLAGGTGFTRAFHDLARDKAANNHAADFIRAKIAAIVQDPATRDALTPMQFGVGAKRICVDSGYFETFNRPNVRLVDLKREPITQITETGITTAAGELAFDSIVFATGFDAMTGSLLRIKVAGRGGETLQEKWAAGPRTYLGLMTAGFPNMFFVAGPGSPSVLGNVVVAIEQHVDWITGCLAAMRDRDDDLIEPQVDAEDDWVEHVNVEAAKTLFHEASSWYLGANVPGKARIFMPYAGGFGTYRQRCDGVAAKGYEGFALSKVRARVAEPSMQ